MFTRPFRLKKQVHAVLESKAALLKNLKSLSKTWKLLIPTYKVLLHSDIRPSPLCGLHLRKFPGWLLLLTFLSSYSFSLTIRVPYIYPLPSSPSMYQVLTSQEYRHEDNLWNMSRHTLLSLICKDDTVTHEMIHCLTCFSRCGNEFVLTYPFLCLERLVPVWQVWPLPFALPMT